MADLTLARGTTAHAELEISRSRFLGYARRIDSEAAARAFFSEIRGEFPDARHHCTALTVRAGVNPIERSSDDGEPSGTAGMPMLAALRGSGLIDTALVVVRYFGGIKLGTGGLVRAYTDAALATLQAARVVELKAIPAWELTVDAADAGRLHAGFEGHGITVADVVYGSDPQRPADALFTLTHPDEDAFAAQLAALTLGEGKPRRISDRIVEVAQ